MTRCVVVMTMNLWLYLLNSRRNASSDVSQGYQTAVRFLHFIQTWQRLMHNIKSLDKKLFFHLNLELIEIFNKFINNFLFFCWFSKIIIMLLFLDKFSYLILNFTEKLDYLGNCELTEFKLQIYQIKFLIWYFVKWFLYHALD